MPNKKVNPKLTPQMMETLDSIWKLEKIILDTLEFDEVVHKVVDSILLNLGYLELGYKVVVLALLDEKEENLKRIALSQTHEAEQTRAVSSVPFEEIVIPMTANENYCIKAIKENKPQTTHYFPDILTPPVSPENALKSQRNAGIKTSMVYPLNVRGKTIGVMIFSMVKSEEDVTDQEKTLIQYFTDLVGLAVQNSRIHNDLEKEKRNLELANIKLRQLDKAKDEFISITSHELKTPMSIIKSYLWMIQSGRGGPLTEKQIKYLDKAMQGSDRMVNLINDMLNISRMEQGKLEFKIEKVNVTQLLQETVDEFEFKLKEKDLALFLNLNKNLPEVYTDKGKLLEIIMNLISNATKYTDSGSVTIALEDVGNSFVKLSVTDTGRGISKEETNKLFKKFQRLDNSYQTMAKAGGTGLGLYIIRLYMSNLGGSIGADSEGLGLGSTFWITLPTDPLLIKKGGINARLEKESVK